MIVHEGRNPKILCSFQGYEYKGKNSEALKLHMCRHKLMLPRPALLPCSAVDALYFQRLTRIVPVLLRMYCSTTLTELKVDPNIAVSLMSQGVALENVEYLHLDYGILKRLEPGILENFRKFDFTCIFPKLRIVCVRGHNI